MREPEPINTGAGHLRAADADRRRVTAAIERHYLDGRLTMDEMDARLGRALAAHTLGDLTPLLADLPSIADRPERRATGQRPARRSTRDLRTHAVKYALVMALLVVIWAATDPTGYFWPIWPMLGWGIGLLAHALGPGGVTARISGRPAHGRYS